MLDFTVAIPTYNGEQRLPEVLDRLKHQIDVGHLSWEVLVVDNNSSDGTAEVVRQYQQQWLKDVPLRYIKETRQGAAFARHTAAQAAHGQYVGFLDDDNLPASNWVAAAHQFGEAHPRAGAFGSQIHGDFEVTPPAHFKRIATFLAIIERGSRPHLYEPRKKMLPPGAGLVVRRDVWVKTVPEHLTLNNKGKSAGLASEDLEAILHVQKAGWEIWYNPTMEVFHQIPAWRLERDYLVSLFRCVGLSRHRIRMLGVEKAWHRPFAFVVYFLNDLRKLLLHIIQHQQHLSTDTIVACERELLVCSLRSPFFLWYKRLTDAEPLTPQPVQESRACL